MLYYYNITITTINKLSVSLFYISKKNKDTILYGSDEAVKAAKKKTPGEPNEAVSPAQRRARKKAYLLKTMKKYGDAAKMGIPADQVNQRRNAPTRKKT